MPTFTLGQAAYVNKGAYSASTAYAALNTVYYNGGTWVALRSVTGVTPGTDNTAWLCVTNGLRSITFAAGETGYMTVSAVLTDGTPVSASIPVGAIGAGTITVDMLASAFVLPVGKGGTGAITADAARANLGAQKAIQKVTGTLTANGWNASKQQTLSVQGLLTTSEFIAQPNNKTGWAAAQSANLYPPTAQDDGLVFEVDTIPAADIPVTVYWW